LEIASDLKEPLLSAPRERPRRPWCLFRSGQGAYAVGLDAVAEVVEVERLVRLPLSPPGVLGLCTLRRDVIPVLGLQDPGEDAGGPERSEPAFRCMVMVLRTNRGLWALRINPEGTSVAEEPTSDEPTDGQAGGAVTVSRGGTTYKVIDTEAAWASARRSVDDWYCDRWGDSNRRAGRA
jgi:purine-binding chemotaxis protein CheW